jgi:two-component system, cell cycle sensor histidine kinase and response regulator CckA
LLDATTLAILDCSDEARAIFAHDSFELTGTSFLQLHGSHDAEIVRESLRRGETNYSTRMVETGGVDFSVDVAVQSTDCEGTSCLIVWVNITGRAAVSDAKLEHAELEMVTSRAPVMLWSVDRDLRFSSASGSNRNLPDEKRPVGVTMFEYFETRDPEFVPIKSHLRAFAGESVAYEYEFRGHTFECWLEPLRGSNGEIVSVIGVATDVTAQRQIQTQLQMSEERNRAIIENATDVIYTHDLRGNFTSVSPAAEELAGYKTEEALTMNMSQVIAPDHFAAAMDHIHRKLRGEPVNSYELDIIRKDGKRVPVEVSTKLIFRDGAPVGIQGIARDLTDRHTAERALRESETRFRAVTETAASAIFICSGERFSYVNSGSEEITGYSAAELYTKRFWEIVHPEFRDLVRVRGTARLAGDTISPNRYEFKIVRKNGEERWVDFTAGVIEDNGKNALLGTAFDITERKRTEQELQIQKKQLEELFQTAPEGIVILDPSGAVLQANDEFLTMFGFEMEDVLGKTIDGFIVPPTKREEAAALNLSMRKGYAAIEETSRCRKDGTMIDVSILAKPLTITHGQVGRFVIYRDITAHRRAEQVREVQFSTTQILSIASSPNDAAARLLPSLAEELGWDYARMWVMDGSLHCVRSWQIEGAQPLEHFATPGATSEGVRTVLNSGESLWIADLVEIALWPQSVVQQSGVRSLFAFAIRTSSGIYGVLEFASRTPRQPDFELLKVLNDIGAQVGQFVERKNAERAVLESESKFRAVADTAASAIFILGAERLLYVNHWTEKITGYTRDELLNMDVWRIVHPDDASDLRERLRRRFSGQENRSSFEFRIMNRHGQSRWLEYSASPIGFEGQMAVLATAFDITDRKRSEQLQSALFRITSLASNTTDLAEVYRGIHQIVGELMYARNFYIAVLDEASNTIEFPYFVDEEDPEPPPPQQRSRGLTDFVLRTGQPLFADPKRFQELVDSGDVESRGAPSIDWLGVPLKTADQTFGVLTVQSYSENVRYGVGERDILTFVSQQVARAIENRRNQDALQQSEVRYRSQVQSALYGLYRSSVDGRFLDVNPALVQMLGYDSAEEMLALDMGRDLYFDIEERKRIINEVGAATIIKGIEAHWRRKDGKVITVRLSGRGGVRYNNEPPSFEMIAEDITERRQLEEQLRHSQKMEAVGRLAGGIAHDFNNLLTVIKGYSDLMLSEVRPGDRLRNEVEEIRKAADRAAALTRQLLAFSRRQVLDPRVLDLNSVVNNMDRLMRRLIGDDVQLYTALDTSLGMVKADPGQIEQVIMNLAVNARDAMPTGGRLTIETANVELDDVYATENGLASGGKFAMLAVTDNGMGMNAETRSQIFEPFFTTKELGKGTGLGLSTVYGIVKQSGGHISCYSEAGKGSSFKVYLPIVATSKSVVQDFNQQPRLAPEPRNCNETVLLVEDEDGVRALVRQVLERDGYTVMEASNGTEAMLHSEQFEGRIHLLLTDVVLTQMSGREIAKEVLAKRTDAKVLFISGYTEEAIVRHGVLESGTAFLQKPFTPAALSRKVREVLDSDSHAVAASTT